MKFSAALRREIRGTTWQTILETTGRVLLDSLAGLGDFFLFAGSFFRWSVRPPLRKAQIFRQMEFIGVRSLPIIALTSTFTGMVFALQTGYAFRLFNAEALVGSTVGLALSREIAPVFTALMVVARAGSAMAAEIGTMQVTEQVEALETMAVSPVQHLVVPRVLAGCLMTPCLAALFAFIGVAGAYFVSVHFLGISDVSFVKNLAYYVDADDFVGGLLKAAVFGFALTLISCYCGYRTVGGAEGVGRSTTRAVVASSVAILVINYFLTSLIIDYLPEF